MNEDELKLAILVQPFEPVRIHLTNGNTFDVKSPGAITIGRRTSGVVVRGGVQVIANLHVAHIEPLGVAKGK